MHDLSSLSREHYFLDIIERGTWQARRQISRLESENARLRESLQNCVCSACGGAGGDYVEVHTGDPRDDNARMVWRTCPICHGSKLHPMAAAALGEVRDE